jgi:hypothetical protein
VRAQYDSKLCNLLETYNKCFIVHADNVGSRQFQDVRRVCAAAPAQQPASRRACHDTLSPVSVAPH